MGILQHLINGISIGSVYAIIALGYTMVYGIAKMLNFAHGDVIMVGAYTIYSTIALAHFPGWLGVLSAVVFCGVLGVVIPGQTAPALLAIGSMQLHPLGAVYGLLVKS